MKNLLFRWSAQLAALVLIGCLFTTHHASAARLACVIDETDGGKHCTAMHDDMATFLMIQQAASMITNVAFGSEPFEGATYGPPTYLFIDIDFADCVAAQTRAQEVGAINTSEVYEQCMEAKIISLHYEEMLDKWADKLMTCETAVDLVGAATGWGAARAIVKKLSRKRYHEWLDSADESNRSEIQSILSEKDAYKIALHDSKFTRWTSTALGWIIGDALNESICAGLQELIDLAS